MKQAQKMTSSLPPLVHLQEANRILMDHVTALLEHLNKGVVLTHSEGTGIARQNPGWFALRKQELIKESACGESLIYNQETII